jgi:DNA-binding NarL/FixJ family response regulator
VQLQETQLQEKLKVREALELYASFYPDPADWRELLERWGLAGQADTVAAGDQGGGAEVSQIIRLLIADDHPVVRDGLRGIFEASGEFEVAGEAANGREAVDRATALRPDVVLMDLRMPVLDGVSAIKLLAEKGVGARVLVLTTFDTDTDVVPAIEAGATGYLLKDSPPDELLRGVRAAARGRGRALAGGQRPGRRGGGRLRARPAAPSLTPGRGRQHPARSA